MQDLAFFGKRAELIEETLGFTIAHEGEVFRCARVDGFHKAMRRVSLAEGAPPLTLSFMGPSDELAKFFAHWAEDTRDGNRTITVSRTFDRRSVRIFATLSAYGHGTPTMVRASSMSFVGGKACTALVRTAVHRGQPG